ncbi:MAG: S9 family peptidase, partial [Planctomycetota bacterium]
VQQDEGSAPYFIKPYYYYHHYLPKYQYPIYCRKKESLEAVEEILLDLNELAKGQHFCQLGSYVVSSDHQWLAYAIDCKGRRLYTIYIKNLKTGKYWDQEIINNSRELVWANDHLTLFYTKKDLQTLRSFQVWRYKIGDLQEELVYEEKDETFRVFVNKSQSRKYLYFISISILSTEYRTLDADKPTAPFKIFHSREPKHEYFLDHQGSHFFIRTNKNAHNFKIMETLLTDTEYEHWREVIPHDEHIFIKEMELFQEYLALQTFQNGLSQIAILHLRKRTLHYLKFEEQTYSVSLSYNPNFDSSYLRFRYQSLTVPETIYDYHMGTGEKILRKQQLVFGNFHPENYHAERLFAIDSEGTKIPISLVYRQGLKRNGKNPLLLEGYGSYGANMEPDFSSSRLSLLDRGFIYAIAHIRGSSTMGRHWYENGKLLQKKNTFTDFITCSEFLIQENYTSSEHLYALGTSAGGMLMGVIANMRPELYHGMIASVPFLDIVTTMLDSSVPLTTIEYDEWGNPENEEYYNYMLSYSPYDNLKAQIYPHLLITTGLYDSQVQYWEPAKWVAKLRTLKRDKNRLLLKTNMYAGHSGASGRYEKMKEIAFEFLFILDLEGITE